MGGELRLDSAHESIMAHRCHVAFLSTLLLTPAVLAHGEGACSGTCDTAGASNPSSLVPTEAVLIQRHVFAAKSAVVHTNMTSPPLQQSYCSVGDAVRCPGSDIWCSGEECCPG